MISESVRKVFNILFERWGKKRTIVLAWLFSAGIVALIIETLIFVNLGRSALLYLLIPYGVSILIAVLRSYTKPNSIPQAYVSHMLTATVFFLATSVILREGFVCVVFFMPIYFAVVTLTYLIRAISHKRNKNKLFSLAVPVLVLVMSMEGTNELMTLSRDNHIQASKVVPLSVQQIKANLAKPFDLQKERHWMISVFPMPFRVDAGSLNSGDVHKIYTRYHRWFVTNTHEGEAELLIESVAENRIKTRMLSDSTYFASYVKIYGTEITFEALGANQTKINLKIDFQRRLDPAWYFEPLQKFGIQKMAEFLIEEIMIRG